MAVVPPEQGRALLHGHLLDGLDQELPHDRSPTSTARRWSCSAPASTSLALADPMLINTTSGSDVLIVFSDEARIVSLNSSSRPRTRT